MKNIQVFDGALNAVYDIFEISDEAFAGIFPDGTDVAFIDEVLARLTQAQADAVFATLWARRIPKRDAMGIHGQLFYGMAHKMIYYPTRRDEDAVNPDGTPLRSTP